MEIIEELSFEAYQNIYEFLVEDYHERTVVDKVHAYLLDGPGYLSNYGIVGGGIVEASKQMNMLFSKHFGEVRC